MKNVFLCILSLCLFSIAATSQNVRLNAYGQYLFDDHVESYYSNTSYYSGQINGGLRWGAGIEYMAAPTYGVELLYMRQDTKVPLTYWDSGDKNREFDLGASWLMICGTRYMPKDKFEPYGSFMLGAVFSNISNPTNGNSSSATKFGYGFRLGSNIYFSESLGLKIQADVTSVSQAVGGGLYFGTGGGGVGVSTYSTIWQFGLGGGLVFRFGTKPTTTTTQKPNY